MKGQAQRPGTATIRRFPTEQRKCPVGSAARHPEFGWCEVVGASELQRVVRYEHPVEDAIPDTSELPAGVRPEDILMSETIYIHEATVDVRYLKTIDPWRDCGREHPKRGR